MGRGEKGGLNRKTRRPDGVTGGRRSGPQTGSHEPVTPTPWRQALDEAAVLDDANHAYRSRRLHVSATFGGMVRLDGNLDPEGGEIALSALGSITDNYARTVGDR